MESKAPIGKRVQIRERFGFDVKYAYNLVRLFYECEQWALGGAKPSEVLKNLRNDRRIALFPELAAMIDVPQDPEWHPEGDVWRHTLLVCDAAAGIAGKEQLLQTDVIVLLLSSLCHDVGKPVTADPERESIVPRQQRVLNRAMFDSPQFRGRSRSENA